MRCFSSKRKISSCSVLTLIVELTYLSCQSAASHIHKRRKERVSKGYSTKTLFLGFLNHFKSLHNMYELVKEKHLDIFMTANLSVPTHLQFATFY